MEHMSDNWPTLFPSFGMDPLERVQSDSCQLFPIALSRHDSYQFVQAPPGIEFDSPFPSQFEMSPGEYSDSYFSAPPSPQESFSELIESPPLAVPTDERRFVRRRSRSSSSDEDERSVATIKDRNAQAAAKYRKKRKNYMENLEKTVEDQKTKLATFESLQVQLEEQRKAMVHLQMENVGLRAQMELYAKAFSK